MVRAHHDARFTGGSRLLMEDNPYAVSASSLDDVSRPALEGAGNAFRNLSGISRNLSILLLVGVAWQALDLISSFMQLNLLSHPPYSMTEATANDLRERLVSVGEGVLFVVTAVIFARWIYLAHKNLPELGARYLRFSPGWSVGSLFVPIVSWWAPYQAMRDLVKASRNPGQWELEDTPPFVVIWWALWLAVQFLGNSGLQSAFHAHTLQQLKHRTMVDIAATVLSVPLYLLARHIVRRVWRDQSENYGQMTSASTSRERLPTSTVPG